MPGPWARAAEAGGGNSQTSRLKGIGVLVVMEGKGTWYSAETGRRTHEGLPMLAHRVSVSAARPWRRRRRLTRAGRLAGLRLVMMCTQWQPATLDASCAVTGSGRTHHRRYRMVSFGRVCLQWFKGER
jgi:hypothetical protein